MAQYGYVWKTDKPHGKAVGRDLSISYKHSSEVCRAIRHKQVGKVKVFLQEVVDLKRAIPYKRYVWDLGHKKSVSGPGRYPVKTCKQILSVVESAEANAEAKGLSSDNLVLSHVCAHKASTPLRYGRIRGREMKRSNIEVVLTEKKEGVKSEVKKPNKKFEKTELKSK